MTKIKSYIIKRTGFVVIQKDLDEWKSEGYSWKQIASHLGISAIYLRQIRVLLK